MIDFWVPCLVAVETEPVPAKFVGWIKDDLYSMWFCALEAVATSLIIEIAIMMVTTRSSEDLFRPAVRRELRRCLTFIPDAAHMTTNLKASLQIKHNHRSQLHCNVEPYISSEDYNNEISIVDSDDLPDESMALHVADGEELEMQLLENNDNYEMRDANEETGFLQKHNEDIMRINNEFSEVAYHNVNVQTLHVPIKTQEEISRLALSLSKKGLAGSLDHVRDFVEYERKRCMAHMMAAARRSKFFEKQLAELEEEEKIRASAEAALQAQLARNKDLERQVEKKRIAADEANRRFAQTQATLSFGDARKAHGDLKSVEQKELAGVDSLLDEVQARIEAEAKAASTTI